MKICYLILFLLFNFYRSQKSNNDFQIQDLNNTIKINTYLKDVNSCDLLIFAKANHESLLNPHNSKNANLIFSQIARKTKKDIFVTNFVRHGQAFIKTIREDNFVEQIDFLIVQNKCLK